MTQPWRIYISHDCCNDFTWGNDETSTRDNLAEMLRAHLDVMTKTDNHDPDERDHYTATTFIEAVCFLQKYPERKDELVRRTKEGRLTLSPWLCNTQWGSMSPEGTLRAMSAARRLELETGIPISYGNHSEMPSLPLGVVPLLAGAGVKWVVVPWLLFDTVWAKLETPPIICHEGPDGSQVKFIFDHYASMRGLYIQGLKILENPQHIPEWTAHYESLGESYPLTAFFAAGTHHDLFPDKRFEIEPLNQKLSDINRSRDDVRLVNASLTRFVNEVGEPNAQKFPVEKRSFGISWEAWPVGLAGIMAKVRLVERAYYDAEALLALATLKEPRELEYTEAARHRADDVIAMLGEHAWNGMNERSHRINQHLRRNWAGELEMLGETLSVRAQEVLTTQEDGQYTLFNPLGQARRDIVRVAETHRFSVSQNWRPFVQQQVLEDGVWNTVFVSPEVAAFSSVDFHQSNPTVLPPLPETAATDSSLENIHFSLKLGDKNPGLASLVHRATGAELRVGDLNIAETIWWAGKRIPLEVTSCELLSHGPVLTRLAQHSSGPGLDVTTFVTAYPDFDHIDIEVRLHKTVFHDHERVTQVFPVAKKDAVPLAQTPGAFLRVAPSPHGDLHPDADRTRLALDNFVQVTHDKGLCSIATLESYLLRPDLGLLSIECLGNDQNSPEVSHDQGGDRHFRFRYRLRFDAAGTPLVPTALVKTAQWAANFAHPLMFLKGKPNFPDVAIVPESSRVVTQCLKPALDGRALVLRYWEVTGSSEPLKIKVSGVSSVSVCDLLERSGEALVLQDGVVHVPVRGWGFGAVRLES
jgi:hypothetical protein